MPRKKVEEEKEVKEEVADIKLPESGVCFVCGRDATNPAQRVRAGEKNEYHFCGIPCFNKF